MFIFFIVASLDGFSNLFTIIIYFPVVPSSAVTIIEIVFSPVSIFSGCSIFMSALSLVGTAVTSIFSTLCSTSISYWNLFLSKSILPGFIVKLFKVISLLLGNCFAVLVMYKLYFLISPLALVTLIVNLFTPYCNFLSPISPDIVAELSVGVALIVIVSLIVDTL